MRYAYEAKYGDGYNQYFRSQRQIVTQYNWALAPGSYIAPLKFGCFNYNANAAGAAQHGGHGNALSCRDKTPTSQLTKARTKRSIAIVNQY